MRMYLDAKPKNKKKLQRSSAKQRSWCQRRKCSYHCSALASLGARRRSELTDSSTIALSEVKDAAFKLLGQWEAQGDAGRARVPDTDCKVQPGYIFMYYIAYFFHSLVVVFSGFLDSKIQHLIYKI